jgi:TP901 family phage tail tape measure protein
MAAIDTKDIYKGTPNPFKDVSEGAKMLIKTMDQIIAKGKELSQVSTLNIKTNPKQTASDFRALNTEVSKLNKTTKESNEIAKQRKLLQDQLKRSTDEEVRARIRYKQAVIEQRKEITQLIKWQTAEKKSIDRLNAANAILRKRVRGVSAATEEGRKKIQAYNKVIDRNTLKVKQLSDAQTRQLKNVGNYGTALKGVGSALGVFTSGVLLAATAVRKSIDITKQAIEVNREFEKTFANVLTLLDEAQKQEFGDVLAVGAVDVMANYGIEVGDVNKALFDVISNGIEAGEAIDFLNKSAVLATAGNAQLSDVVKGATKVYQIYKDEIESVDEIMNAFFAAQVDGATDVNLLANNIGKVAGTAKKAGIPISELFGTFAGLTKSLDGTEESATALVNIINSLIKASPAAQKEFKKYGIETGIVAVKQNGLLETILKVVKATEENEDAIVKLIPNIRAFKGIATLTEDSIDELKDTIEKLNDQELSAALLQEAFNEQMETGQKQADLLQGSWNRLLITLGGGESIFKRIGTLIRSELTTSLDTLTFSIEITTLTWQRLIGELTKEEYRAAIDELRRRFGELKDEINEYNEVVSEGEVLTKQQIVLINQYNKELGKNLKLTRESYEIAKKHFEIREKEVRTLKTLKEELKTLREFKENIDITDKESIKTIAQRIKALQDEIKALEDLGKVTIPKVDVEFDFSVPDITDDLDFDEAFSKQIDEEIDEIGKKLDIIDDLYSKHYDSLLALGFNFANRKAAQDKDLSAKELQAIIDNNAQIEAAYQQLADTLISISNQILQNQLNNINTEISVKNQQINELEQSLNRELALLEAGAANEYATEKEKLRKLQIERDKDIAERKRIQEQQETINTLTQISELATAVATIINSAVSELGWAGVVAGLAAAAAAIVGFSTYKSEAESAATAEDGGTFSKEGTRMEKGKRHSGGGNKYSSVEFEKGELTSVFSRKASKKYKDEIYNFEEAVNSDQLDNWSMYRNALSSFNINNTVINGDQSVLLEEIRNTNRMMSKQVQIVQKGDKFYFYSPYGKRIGVNLD